MAGSSSRLFVMLVVVFVEQCMADGVIRLREKADGEIQDKRYVLVREHWAYQ